MLKTADDRQSEHTTPEEKVKGECGWKRRTRSVILYSFCGERPFPLTQTHKAIQTEQHHAETQTGRLDSFEGHSSRDWNSGFMDLQKSNKNKGQIDRGEDGLDK